MLSLRPNSEVQEAIKKTMAGTRMILWDSSFADGRGCYLREREREEGHLATVTVKPVNCTQIQNLHISKQAVNLRQVSYKT